MTSFESGTIVKSIELSVFNVELYVNVLILITPVP